MPFLDNNKYWIIKNALFYDITVVLYTMYTNNKLSTLQFK